MPATLHNPTEHGLSVAQSYCNRVLDAAIIWLSLYLLRHYFPIEQSNQQLYVLPGLLAIIVYFFIAEFFSLYRSNQLGSFGQTIQKIAFIWFSVTLSLIAIALVTKSSADYSRLTIGSWLIVCPLAIMTSHFIVRSVFIRFGRQNNRYSYMILGEGEMLDALPHKIAQATWAQFHLAGTFHALPKLIEQLEQQPVDFVFLAYASYEQHKIHTAITALQDSTASIYLVPDLLLSDLLGSRWIMLGDTPLVIINDHPFYGGWRLLKTMEDLLLALAIITITSPIMLIIALAVKLSSPGPVLFKQRRHGLNGEVIKIYKFRTMTTLEDGEQITQAKQEDPRVTQIGQYLRRYSLDELPQFFNVLQGSMSIVGPRPHALAHNEYYRQLISGYMQRHKVKPGITGWAQIHGLRGETDTIEKMKKRVEYDLYYINHWSIGLDLKIILLTIFKGFHGKTAY